MSSYLENRERIIELAGEVLKERGFEVKRFVKYNIIDEDFDIKEPAQYQPYNYIVKKNGRQATVSVKIAIHGRMGKDNKGKSKDWRITSWTKKEPPTFYMVWMPEHEEFIDIPGNFFAGFRGDTRTIPQEYMAILRLDK